MAAEQDIAVKVVKANWKFTTVGNTSAEVSHTHNSVSGGARLIPDSAGIVVTNINSKKKHVQHLKKVIFQSVDQRQQYIL